MEQNHSADPRVVRRKGGGWLAVSAATDSLKIGVSAPTADEAKAKLVEAVAAWGRILASDSKPAEC